MYSSLLECSAVSSSDDQLVGLLVLLSRLSNQEQACPHGVDGPGRPIPVLPSPPPCGWSFGFITEPRTVGRIPMWRLRPALPILIRLCSAFPTTPYSRSAVQRNHSHLSGGQTKGRVLAFLSHELRAVSCGTNHLSALARMQLDIVYLSTYGNLGKRQAVADSYLGLRSVHDLHAVLESLGSQDICLLTVCVADQRDICGTVRIVLDADYRSRDAIFSSLEVDDSVFSSWNRLRGVLP